MRELVRHHDKGVVLLAAAPAAERHREFLPLTPSLSPFSGARGKWFPFTDEIARTETHKHFASRQFLLLNSESFAVGGKMLKVKDTLRSTVNLTFDGRVIKTYHGPDAETRFHNEVRVLRHLEARGCNFVPRLLKTDEKKLRIITNNCGTRVEHLDAARQRELFAELKKFGVRHDDADLRNVTYRQSDGRFCLIDFEFATILD